MDKLRIERIVWVKIDVEGAEYEVVKGLEDSLQGWKPTVIIELCIIISTEAIRHLNLKAGDLLKIDTDDHRIIMEKKR